MANSVNSNTTGQRGTDDWGSELGVESELGVGSAVVHVRRPSVPTIYEIACFGVICVILPALAAVAAVFASGILGALGAAGIISGMVVSVTLIVSGSITCLAAILIYAMGHKGKVALLIASLASLLFVTIGILGATHVLSGVAVGWVSIGNTLVIIGGVVAYSGSSKSRRRTA